MNAGAESEVLRSLASISALRSSSGAVAIEPFEAMEQPDAGALAADAADVVRFLSLG